MTITLTNTLTRKKEPFTPADDKNVRMYVCGPTVYDRPHIGNARSVVVYDVLYRLLRHTYGDAHVTYVRNLTDVDDKINKAAKERGISIRELTEEITGYFHADMAALGCLPPDEEPRATEHIKEMQVMIAELISNGYAYPVTEGSGAGHVYFDILGFTGSPPDGTDYEYGFLSGRKLDEMLKEVRKEASPGKKNPGDFVLWKPAAEGDDPSSVFDWYEPAERPNWFAKGRPGWHIECSAMSTKYLGNDFDIHGGGADLKFPHHENEIAQSCGAHPGTRFAKTWVHNGFLTVNGEKMSKSLGNFFTVREVIDQLVERYWPNTEYNVAEKCAGEVIRYVFLGTKYNEPLDWTEKRVEDAKKALDRLYGYIQALGEKGVRPKGLSFADSREYDPELGLWMDDDVNTPATLVEIASILREAATEKINKNAEIKFGLCSLLADMVGILVLLPEDWFGKTADDEADITALINARAAAKADKNFAEADRIKAQLKAMGIELMDRRDGPTDWRRV